MDVKGQINKIVEEVSKNPNMKEQFEREPVKVIEKIVGIDLPDDVIMKVIDGVKAKMAVDGASKTIDALKGIFNK